MTKESFNPGQEVQAFIKNQEVKLYSTFQRNILSETPRFRPTGFEDILAETMGTGDYLPVVVMTHKSHAAGPMGMEEAAYVREVSNTVLPPEEQLQGTLLIIAHNIENGQSGEIGKYYTTAKPLMDELHVEPVYVVRDKDAIQAGKIAKEDSMRNHNNKLSHMVEEGTFPLILAEGTVESGRQKAGGLPGEIKGMQPVYDRSMALMSQTIRRQGRIPLFIPIGTQGEHTIYDPNVGKPTSLAKRTAIARAFPFLRESHPHLMQSIVGYPVSYNDLVRDLGEGEGVKRRIRPEVLDSAIGEILAKLVPENERGVYANPHYIDQLHIPKFSYEQAQRMYHFS